jgi:hypothetical protein
MGPELRRNQTNAVQKGLDLSRATAKKEPEVNTWQMWQFHFHLEKAELKMADLDFRSTVGRRRVTRI